MQMIYTIEEYKRFLMDRTWSVFKSLTDEELMNEFLRITKNKEQIIYNDEIALLTIQKGS